MSFLIMFKMMTGIVPDWAVAPLKAFYGAKYDTFD